ncbi:MAG: glycosyl hydrolase [Flavisolibacter sp.]
MRRIFFLALFLFFIFHSFAQLKWPTVNSVTKPWTRWWWEGSAVNKKDLTWNLEQYQKAGLGGVEITPIYGVYGYENQFIDFLSPKWMDVFKHTLNESKRLGLGVDLANATGWPFGGPWVKDEDASKTVYYKTYSLNPGEQLNELIRYKQEALVRTANNKAASIDTIKQPVSKNKNLQALALDQIIYPMELSPQAVVAYNESGTVIDISSKVGKDGKLNWVAPAGKGKWILYALFTGLHGKMVERGAPGGEGYAIDHFSSQAAKNYFKKFDEAFKGQDISYLRAFFNDSYEVDDAKGQANWTPSFFDEFKKRRGYDLKDELPALFGKDQAEKNARVLYDYRATIDELLLHNFTEQWKHWAASKRKIVRNQSHGSPANTLDLYDAVDIPETEGTDILRFKFATSAANVGGKPLAASESVTWLNEHFLSSLGDVKKAIDLYFLGGVNHIVYHGSAYSPKDAPWPGWLFYAAVHFQTTNPQWKDFSTLNQYITRVQSFLQKARPDNDVLLYYPLIDRYSEPGTAMLQHFDGMERNFEGTNFEHISKWMLENGYGFDFFSDRQLQRFTISGSTIRTGGNNYQVILLPANKLISNESFQKLISLARNGATILVYKNLPEDVPGLAQLEKRRNSFRQMLSALSFVQNGNLRKAIVGKGAFVMSDDLETLLKSAHVRRENHTERGLSSIRKRNTGGTVYFIDNRSNKAVNEWIELNASASSVVLFGPMSGKAGLAKWRKTANGIEVEVQLLPFESIIVQTYKVKKTGEPFKYKKLAGDTIEINGNWSLQFLNGGPVLPANSNFNKLVSWTESNDVNAKNFSGVAKYSIQFLKPAGNADEWLLDLGEVHETAEVFLNGKKIATLIGPNFQCAIASSLLKPTNSLEVVVANLMANRISYMDKNHLPWKIFYNINMPARKRENVKNGLFDASSWQPSSSGLLGPVTLTAITYE